MENGPFRFLFITADEFPPYRPDVEVLFGKELLGRGYQIDWIMRAAGPDGPTGCVEWLARVGGAHRSGRAAYGSPAKASIDPTQ